MLAVVGPLHYITLHSYMCMSVGKSDAMGCDAIQYFYYDCTTKGAAHGPGARLAQAPQLLLRERLAEKDVASHLLAPE